MKRFALWLGLFSCSAASAQQTPPALPVAPDAPVPTAAEWVTVGPGQTASLAALVPRQGTQAIELDVSLQQLQAEPKATEALQGWVREGGAVVLHTDAAQVFGLGTQPLRVRTREFAGQGFLRTANALPFGAHRLLWAPTSQSLDGTSSGFLGVRTVFARPRFADAKVQFEGDALVNDLGAGVPLLRVSDVAPNPQPLYAGVIVTYGRGVALFCPRGIETGRADGAQFQQNLRAFLSAVQSGQWVWLPSAPLLRPIEAVGRDQKLDYEPLLAALQSALQPDLNRPARLDKTASSGLWLQREEAQTLQTLWQEAQDGKDAATLAVGAGLVLELVARLELQKDTGGGPPQTSPLIAALFGRDPARRGLLFQTQEGRAHEAATRWWCGVFALAAAIPPLSTEPQR